MPFRTIASRALAETLAVLGHPCRLRIIEEIGGGEHDVATLAQLLGISHSGTSQHLSRLRARRLVTKQRQGRQVFYQLSDPALSKWLLAGLAVLEQNADTSREVKTSLRRARAAWAEPSAKRSPPRQPSHHAT